MHADRESITNKYMFQNIYYACYMIRAGVTDVKYIVAAPRSPVQNMRSLAQAKTVTLYYRYMQSNGWSLTFIEQGLF
jgi:hypothetical protein